MSPLNNYLYPSYVFRDPLLWLHFMPNVLKANEGVARQIDYNVQGDPFLGSYITKLDEEIFAEMPSFDNDECKQIWTKNRLNLLFSEAADEMRKHGWCVVQFYGNPSETEDEEEATEMEYKVYSGRNFVEWITELDANERKVRIGVKIRHYDDIGNNYDEDLIFSSDNLCFLLTWKKDKTGRRYGEPDLNQSIMTIAYNIRQINGQLTYIGIKPSFLHFVYGKGKSTDLSTSLKSKMQYVDKSAGIGAKESQLSEIREISNGDIEMIEIALDKQIKLYAGATRLPLSFYIGEREKSGLGETGEASDLTKLNLKKKFIFDILRPYIQDIMLYAFGINTSVDIALESDVIMSKEPTEQQDQFDSD